MNSGVTFLLALAGVWAVFLMSAMLILSAFMTVPLSILAGVSLGVPATVTVVIMLRHWIIAEMEA